MYGWAGLPKNASAGAASISWPAYITTIRSQISWAVPRSWVVKRTETPRSFTSSRRRRRIWAWIVTSSEVVGSSAMIRSGRGSSAIAIISRWRWPPENSWGSRRRARAGSGIWTARSVSSTASRSAR